MKYQYTYRNTPSDYWQFYMGNIYRNWTGAINVIFTAAFFVLTVRKWAEYPLWARGLCVLAVLIFPLFQPLAVWGRAVRTAENITEETTLGFDGSGMEIRVKDHVQRIPWDRFFDRGLLRLRGLLVVIPDGNHAYLLPDRVTGGEKEALAALIAEKSGGAGK